MVVWYALKPIIRLMLNLFRKTSMIERPVSTPGLEIAGAFLLAWWLMGIFPAFVSVPPASLGHTIIAQPATYIILAVPVFGLERLGHSKQRSGPAMHLSRALPLLLAAVLLISLAWRDLPDYFQHWPSRGMTRFLYRADIKDLASYLNQHPEMTDFGVTGLLAGPWDREALAIDLDNEAVQRPRWYNPERVVLLRVGDEQAQSFIGYPLSTTLEQLYYEPVVGETAGGYQLATLDRDMDATGETICFQNNLCLLEASYQPDEQVLDLTLELNGPLEIPSRPLISNPPPPGVNSGPRLHIFSQLLDEAGEMISGDDGFWIDAQTLQPGDRFLQQHRFSSPPERGAVIVIFGLYDPMTGERIMTVDGRDNLQIEIGN